MKRVPPRFPKRAARSAALVAILAAVLAAGGGSIRAQCAMCEGSSAAGADGGAAYNSSTLFMLAVPYLLLGGIGGYVVWSFRRPRRTPPRAEDDSAGPEPR